MSTDQGRERIRVAVVAQDEAGSPRAVRRGAPSHELVEGFCAGLARATGAAASPVEVPHYRDLLDAMHEGRVDLAWMPPVVALRATARGRTVPIALPVRSGTAYYSAALFARPDSRIQTAADLRGARAAWVDRHSASGYLVIRASLRQRGVDVDRVFGAETFHGTHAAVAQAVLEGAADVGASFVHLDPRRSKPRRAGWGDAAVRMLATAGPIPCDVIAASIRMPVSMIRRVQRVLLDPPSEDMRRAANELFGAEGFVEATSEHLEPMSDLLNHLDDAAPR
ncbi:MAG: PhnD/SsuA/transferrin family substrate-binding protein [Polyangiaceae bacterium]|nr:PhnD/SsuA/transferrin family substrate-binding protein [Polyangiaceae bacterium]